MKHIKKYENVDDWYDKLLNYLEIKYNKKDSDETVDAILGYMELHSDELEKLYNTSVSPKDASKFMITIIDKGIEEDNKIFDFSSEEDMLSIGLPTEAMQKKENKKK